MQLDDIGTILVTKTPVGSPDVLLVLPEAVAKRLATFDIVQQSLIHFQLYNQAHKVENLLHTAER